MSFEKIIIWVWFIGVVWREGSCNKMEYVVKKITLSYEKLQGGLRCQIWPVKKIESQMQFKISMMPGLIENHNCTLILKRLHERVSASRRFGCM